MSAVTWFARALAGAAGALLLVQPASAAAQDGAVEASRLYDTYCAQCHGVQRNGKGVNTVGLSVQPKDHSDTAAMSSIPREQIIRTIREGGAAANKSALMPPWGSVFTDKQLEDLASYLMVVCKCNKTN